ncbi:MAG TPA: hypothetical protein VNV84_01535, partial [Candidatus Acidoferrales bacterium]|nr:hypothetical protein [Candidatus Acidoferrales bacterium]
WTAALLYYMWLVLVRLRQSRFFPFAFAIIWYVFLLLYPFTYGGLSAYQNFVNNAYMWLLVGVFFKLPELLAAAPTAAPSPLGSRRQRGGLQF